jgi:nucleoside-diphosphate-sugar epimerase
MTINSAHRGLRAIVIRPFNIAGSRQSRAGGFVMPTFVQQALSGQPITVFDSGEQTRAFTSASDLSRFLTDFWDDAQDSEDRVFNIGNPKNRITIRGLAERVKHLLGSDSEIVKVDGREVYGPMYMEAESFDKVPVLGAAARLGWEPQVGLDQLVMETASYYRAHNDYRQVREQSPSVYASH